MFVLNKNYTIFWVKSWIKTIQMMVWFLYDSKQTTTPKDKLELNCGLKSIQRFSHRDSSSHTWNTSFPIMCYAHLDYHTCFMLTIHPRVFIHEIFCPKNVQFTESLKSALNSFTSQKFPVCLTSLTYSIVIWVTKYYVSRNCWLQHSPSSMLNQRQCVL